MVVGDMQAWFRSQVTLVGTPLTHERFLRRHKGSYGPGVRAGEGLIPGCKTPVKKLLVCGDTAFPGEDAMVAKDPWCNALLTRAAEAGSTPI